MEDYIKIKTKMQLGKNSNIRFAQEKDVDNLKEIKIDTNKSKLERIINFLRDVKNPYMFTVDGIKVKFEYSDNGPDINECVENLIRNKNV